MRLSSITTGLVAIAAGAVLGTSVMAQDIRIGFHAPQTGFAAADGKSAVHGAELAVEQINAQGGVLGRKLALVVYDDRREGGTGATDRQQTAR
jgi:branched-chain amino acid transport system substrate-binding protein